MNNRFIEFIALARTRLAYAVEDHMDESTEEVVSDLKCAIRYIHEAIEAVESGWE